MVNIKDIEEKTRKCYQKAKDELALFEKRSSVFAHSALSDVIPNYKSELLEFGAYIEDNFAVLFVDMRNSTKRCEIIDIMGDGIMVFFYGKDEGFTNEIAIKHAGLCGRDMLTVVDQVVNKILQEDGITYKIKCGVGVDYGKTVITKIGIENVFDVKAFGDCINKASKYSNVDGYVKVSKKVKEHWPKGKGGKISFIADGEGYKLTEK